MEKRAIVLMLAIAASVLPMAQAAPSQTTQPATLEKYSGYFDPAQRGFAAGLKDYFPACRAIEKADIRLANTSEQRYAQSSATASRALERVWGLGDIAAQAFTEVARIYKMTLTPAGIPTETIGMLVGNAMMPCNAEAHEATNLVLLANGQAWHELAAKAKQFRQAYGDDGPDGEPKATSNALAAIESDFENSRDGSDSLAGRIMRLRLEADAEAHDERLLTGYDAEKMLLHGASKDSTLQGMYDLDRQIGSALSKLDAIHAASKKKAEAALATAEESLKSFEAEKLGGLDDVTFAATLPSSFSGQTGGFSGYRDTHKKAEELIARGRAGIASAKAATLEMGYGYQSTAIAEYGAAAKELASADEMLSAKLEEADALEGQVNDALAETLLAASRNIEEMRATDPAAAEALENALRKITAGGSTALERIKNGADALDTAEKIAQATGYGASGMLFDLVSADCARLAKMVELAEADGIDAYYEKARLDTLGASLKQHESGKTALTPDELDAIDYEIAALESRILAKASGIASDAEEKYSAARAYAGLFEGQPAQDFAWAEKYFIAGQLDMERALGSIGKISQKLAQLAASAKATSADSVKARLARNLVEKKTNEAARLGKSTAFTRKFTTKNDLQAGYDKEIVMALGTEPAHGFDATASCDGCAIYRSAGKLYAAIPSAKAGEEFAFEVSYSYIAARKTGESQKTAYATKAGARVGYDISFTAEEEMAVLLEIPAPQGAQVRVDGGEKIGQDGDTAIFSYHASAGNNDAVATITTIESPFELEELLTQNGQWQTADLGYANRFFDLDRGAKTEYAITGCTVPKTVTISSADFAASAQGRAITLQAKEAWKYGETKTARINYECAQETAQAAQADASAVAQWISGLAQQESPAEDLAEKTLEIERTAQDLPQAQAVAAITSQARKTAQNATAAPNSTAQATAMRAAEKALEGLKPIANLAVKSIEAGCETPACLREIETAKSLISVGDWIGAFESISKAKKDADASIKAESDEYGAKKAAYEEYEKTALLDARKAIAEYDKATAQAASLSASEYSRLKGEGYDNAAAQKSRDSLEKALAELEKYAPPGKMFNATARELIEEKIAAAKNAASQLKAHTENLKQAAQNHLEAAKQNAQAEENQASLETAERDIEDGQYMAAYAIARQILQESGRQTAAKSAGFDMAAYAPILALVLCGAAAGAYLLNRQTPKKEDIGKPPEDYPN